MSNPTTDGVIDLHFTDEDTEREVQDFMALMREPGSAYDVSADSPSALASPVTREAIRRYRWLRSHRAQGQK